MNFTILAILIITVLGLYFRILPYDNVQGLWNDEYVGWYISQQPLFLPFIKGILSQCHMPLYYVCLKIYTAILGNSDVVLRLSSFITGFLSIFVMFFVGNQKNKILGYLCALFTAISAFVIYYSYEVRPYSLIFLLSALSLLYTIKLLEDDKDKKNIIFYILFNVLILLTHTLGFNKYVCCCVLFKRPKLKIHKKYLPFNWGIIPFVNACFYKDIYHNIIFSMVGCFFAIKISLYVY